jgi:penicillin-binding protein 1A
MTSAYSVFANNGTRNPTTGILSIKDSTGAVVEEFADKHADVYDSEAIKVLNDVLSDPVARIPTFGNGITIPGVAVKTGTTNDDRDAWIVGYTPDLAVGVWSGNNDNSKMKSGGSAVSGPIWKAYMTDMLATTPQTPFTKPITLDNATKPILRGNWLNGAVHDILFWVQKNDPTGPAPENPYSDPQFHLWEPPVQSWWEAHKGNYTITNETSAPEPIINTTTLDIQNLPNSFSRASTQKPIIVSKDPAKKFTSVDIFMNDDYVNTLQAPFSFAFNPKEYGFQKGSFVFKATATDISGELLSASKPITLTE